MAKIDYKQVLDEFSREVDKHPELTKEQLLDLYPELQGEGMLNAAYDYRKTKQANKYDEQTLESKFPEFFTATEEPTQADATSTTETSATEEKEETPWYKRIGEGISNLLNSPTTNQYYQGLADEAKAKEEHEEKVRTAQLPMSEEQEKAKKSIEQNRSFVDASRATQEVDQSDPASLAKGAIADVEKDKKDNTPTESSPYLLKGLEPTQAEKARRIAASQLEEDWHLGKPKTQAEAVEQWNRAYFENTEEGKKRMAQAQTDIEQVNSDLELVYQAIEDKYKKKAQELYKQGKTQDEVVALLDDDFKAELEQAQRSSQAKEAKIKQDLWADGIKADNGWLERTIHELQVAENKAIISELDEALEKTAHDYNQRRSENNKEWNKRKDAFGVVWDTKGVVDPAEYDYTPEHKEERMQAAAAYALRQEADHTMTLTKKGEYELGDFSSDFGKKFQEKVPGMLTFGFFDLAMAKTTAGLLEKMNSIYEEGGKDIWNNPEKYLNETELNLFNAFEAKQAADLLRANDTSWAATAANITAESLPFMLAIMEGQFFTKGVTEAAKRTMTRAIVKRVQNKFLRRTIKGMGDMGVGLAESIVLPALSPYTYERGYEKMYTPTNLDITDDGIKMEGMQSMDKGDAMLNSYLEQVREYFIETGGVTHQLVNAVKGTSVAKKMLNTPVGRFMRDIERSDAGRLATQFAYHRTVPEMGEEHEAQVYEAIGAALSAEKGHRAEAFANKYGEFWDADNIVPMMISFAATSAAFTTVGATQVGIDKYRQYRTGKEAEDAYQSARAGAYSILKEGGLEDAEIEKTLNDLRGSIYNSTPEELTEQIKNIAHAAGVKNGELYTAVGGVKFQKDEGMEQVTTMALANYVAREIEADAHRKAHHEESKGIAADYSTRMEAQDEADKEIQEIEYTPTDENGNKVRTGQIYAVHIEGDESSNNGAHIVAGDLRIDEVDGKKSLVGNGVVTIKKADGTLEQLPASALVLDGVEDASERFDARQEELYQSKKSQTNFQAGDKVGIDANGQHSESEVVSSTDNGVEVQVEMPNGQTETTTIPPQVANDNLTNETTGEGAENAQGAEQGGTQGAERASQEPTAGTQVTFVRDNNGTSEETTLQYMGNGLYGNISTKEVFTEEDLAKNGWSKPSAEQSEQAPSGAEQVGGAEQVQSTPQAEKVSPEAQAVVDFKAKHGDKAQKKVDATLASIDAELEKANANLAKAQDAVDNLPEAYDEQSEKANAKAEKALADAQARVDSLTQSRAKYQSIADALKAEQTQAEQGTQSTQSAQVEQVPTEQAQSAPSAQEGVNTQTQQPTNNGQQQTTTQTEEQGGANSAIVRGSGASKLSQAQVDMLNTIAQNLGVKFEVHDNLGEQENGYYDADTKTVHISADMANDGRIGLNFIAGHEISHAIKDAVGADVWKRYVELCKQSMGEDAWSAKFQEMRQLYDEYYDTLRAQGKEIENLTDEQIEEEMACDFAGEHILTDEQFVRDIFEKVATNTEEAKTILDKVLAIIDQILQAIKGLPSSDTMALTNAKQMWSAMYQATAANEKAKGQKAEKEKNESVEDAYKKAHDLLAEESEYHESEIYGIENTTLKNILSTLSNDELNSLRKEIINEYGDSAYVIPIDIELEKRTPKKNDKTKKKQGQIASFDEAIESQHVDRINKPNGIKLEDLTDDENAGHSVLMGVHYEGGYGVASDGKILFVAKTEYSKEQEGKTIVSDKKRDKYNKKAKTEKPIIGNEIDGKYPNWRSAIPQTTPIKTSVNVEDLRGFIAGAIKTSKEDWEKNKADGSPRSYAGFVNGVAVSIRFPNGEQSQFSLPYLENFADAMDKIGAKTINYYGHGKLIVAESENGTVVLAPLDRENTYTIGDGKSAMDIDGWNRIFLYDLNPSSQKYKTPIENTKKVAKEAKERKQKTEITKQVGGEIEGKKGGAPTRYSVSSIAVGAGMVAFDANDKKKTPLTNEKGDIIFKMGDKTFDGHHLVTLKDIEKANSKLNVMIDFCQGTLKTITPAQAKRIRQSYVDILNTFLVAGLNDNANGGVDGVTGQWQWVAESVYKSISSNADSQYLKSLDITRVCKKNEAVIRTIGAIQRQYRYGITPSQVMDVYLTSKNEGYQVPCPVCYVFSRYINNGQYASIMVNGLRKYADKFGVWTADEWKEEFEKQKKIEKSKEGQIKKAKADIQLALQEIDKESEELLRGIQSGKMSQEEIDAKKANIAFIDAKYRSALEVVSNASLPAFIKNFAINISQDGSYRLYTNEENGDFEKALKTQEGRKDIEDAMLDLSRTAVAMVHYPAIQRFRKSRGSGAGKTIAWESNNEFGEVALALSKSDDFNKEETALDDVVKAKTKEEREKAMKVFARKMIDAKDYIAKQSLRGGQRMWSWSDNIERLAPDVAISLMQIQMLGGALQTYSKQLEGAEMVASVGGYVNGSLMGSGNGYLEIPQEYIGTKDGKKVVKKDYVIKGNDKIRDVFVKEGSPIYEQEGKAYALAFDDVVGIQPYSHKDSKGETKLGLFDLNAQYNRAGNILVGMNDLHIRTAMADDRIFFIIPWHASGLSSHILTQMMDYLGVDNKDIKAQDYTKAQEDTILDDEDKVADILFNLWESHKDEKKFACGIKGGIPSRGKNGRLSAEQLEYRRLRKAIIMGTTLTDADQEVINNDAFLRQLKDSIRNRGISKMTSDDNNHVYPYEYWDKESTYDEADVNGKRYLEYCRRLGVCPKFSGISTSKGKEDQVDEEGNKIKVSKERTYAKNNFGNFVDDKGYWKLLIDRRMYNTEGKFQDLTPIDFGDEEKQFQRKDSNEKDKKFGFQADMINPKKTKEKYDVTVVADSEGVKRIAKKVIDMEASRQGGNESVDYNKTLAQAVEEYKQVPKALKKETFMDYNKRVAEWNKKRKELTEKLEAEKKQQGNVRYSLSKNDAIDVDEIRQKLVDEYGENFISSFEGRVSDYYDNRVRQIKDAKKGRESYKEKKTIESDIEYYKRGYDESIASYRRTNNPRDLGNAFSNAVNYNKLIGLLDIAKQKVVDSREGTIFKKLDIEDGKEYNIDDLRSWFDKFNKNEENKELFDLIMPALKIYDKLGLKVRFGKNPVGDTRSMAGYYSPNTNEIVLISKEWKYIEGNDYNRFAETCLHECIHAVTSNALLRTERIIKEEKHLNSKDEYIRFRSEDRIERVGKGVPSKIIEASKELYDVFESVAKEESVEGMYGTTNVHEMVAELANKQFRDNLKKMNLLDRIIDGIHRFFAKIAGLDMNAYEKTDAYKVTRNALKNIVENYDEKSFYDTLIRKPSNNVRYSLSVTPQQSKSYEDAIKKGNIADAEQIVREVAAKAMPDTKVVDADGKPLVVYHGTSEDFTIFDSSKGRENADIQGMFFTPYADEANDYGVNVKEFYLNITNPATSKVAYDVFDKYKGQDKAGVKAREELEQLGYDGVENDGEYVAFYPEQIKSADAVTYDDNGNVVPLEERFNEGNKDIRYSLNGISSADKVADAFGVDFTQKYNLGTKEAIDWYDSVKKQGGIHTGKLNEDGDELVIIPKVKRQVLDQGEDYTDVLQEDVYDSLDDAINAKVDTREVGKNGQPEVDMQFVFQPAYIDPKGEIYNEGDMQDADQVSEYLKGAPQAVKYSEPFVEYFPQYENEHDAYDRVEGELYSNGNTYFPKTIELDGKTYKVDARNAFKGKYTDVNMLDENGELVGRVQLRVADHSYNPSNNDDSARSGNFISVVLTNNDKTKDKYHGSYNLRFDPQDTTIDEIMGKVIERFDEIVDGWNNNAKQVRYSLASRAYKKSPSDRDAEYEAKNPEKVHESKVPKKMANETQMEYAQRVAAWRVAQLDNQLVADYQGVLQKRGKWLREAEQEFIDGAKPIDRFQQFVVKHGGTLDKARADAYAQMFLSKGVVTQAMEDFEREYAYPMAKQIKALADEVKKKKGNIFGWKWQNVENDEVIRLLDKKKERINGRELTAHEVVEIYAQAKDCQEAAEKGLPDRGAEGFEQDLGMSYEEVIEQFENEFTKEQLDAFWDGVHACAKFALDYQLKGKLIDKATHDAYDRRYYVPQRGWRERDLIGDQMFYIHNGEVSTNTQYNAALVRAKGRKSLAADPFGYLISMANSSIVSTEKNRTKQKFLQFCLDNEEVGLKTGAFHVHKVWGIQEHDANGDLVRDNDGNPLIKMTEAEPTAEQFAHDAEIDKEIAEVDKRIAQYESVMAKAKKNPVNAQFLPAMQQQIDDLKRIKQELQDKKIIVSNVSDSAITQRTSDEKKQHSVVVTKDGQKYYIELQDEQLANAINKVVEKHGSSMNKIADFTRKGTRVLCAGLTQYNPEFALSNFVRDFQFALIKLTSENPKLVLGFIKAFTVSQGAIWQYVVNDKILGKTSYRNNVVGEYLKEYFEHGAATGYSFLQDLDLLRKDLKNMENDNTAKAILRGALGTFSALTEASELSVRFAAYMAARQGGMSADEAATLSKELTTNFDRSGSYSDFMGLYPFMKAAINGNLAALKIATKSKWGLLIYSGWTALFMALGFFLAKPNDPDEERWVGDYHRQMNYIGGDNVRIPVLHHFRMYYAMGVNMADAYKYKTKTPEEAWYETISRFSDEMLPGPSSAFGALNGTGWDGEHNKRDYDFATAVRDIIPGIFQPLTDVAMNRNFMGGTINYESSWNGDQKDILKGKKSTLQIYRDITEGVYQGVGGNMNTTKETSDNTIQDWLDISPSSLEHIVEGYNPAATDLFIGTANMIIRAAKDEDVKWSDVPFARKFYVGYDKEKAYKSMFYEMSNKVKTYESYLNDLKKNDKKAYTKERTSDRYRVYTTYKGLFDDKHSVNMDADTKKLILFDKKWNKVDK